MPNSSPAQCMAQHRTSREAVDGATEDAAKSIRRVSSSSWISSSGVGQGHAKQQVYPATSSRNLPLRSNLLSNDRTENDRTEGLQEANGIGGTSWKGWRSTASESLFSLSVCDDMHQDLQRTSPVFQDAPESRQGFLALKDHHARTSDFSIPLVAKRPKLSAAPSPSFSAPRALNDSCSRSSGDSADGRDIRCAGSATHGQHMSLLDENREHLKHDREVQERFRATAEAKRSADRPPPISLRPAGGIVFPDARTADGTGASASRLSIQDVFASPTAYKRSTFILHDMSIDFISMGGCCVASVCIRGEVPSAITFWWREREGEGGLGLEHWHLHAPIQ